MYGHLAELSDSLAAFATDLGALMNGVTLASLTEFGRTTRENGSGGTDHGYGQAVMLLGGGVKGGQVHGDWPGLDERRGPDPHHGLPQPARRDPGEALRRQQRQHRRHLPRASRTTGPTSSTSSPRRLRGAHHDGESWQTALVDDDRDLLARAEATLTEIKVNHGLSERHEAVLAALRIRLTGTETKTLEEMLEAADDPKPDRFAETLAEVEAKPKASLDDLLAKPKAKPDWPS